MCEAHAYITKSGRETLLMENVDQLDIEGEEIRMVNIFGEQKNVKARIIKYNGSEGRLVLQALD